MNLNKQNILDLDIERPPYLEGEFWHFKHYNPISIKTLMEDNRNLYLLLRQNL
jgi:hypothetical protein